MEQKKKMIISLEIYFPEQCIKSSTQIQADETLENVCIALQMYLKDFSYNKEHWTTFDIYDQNYRRIAIVADQGELYITEEFDTIKTLQDLQNMEITKLVIVALQNPSIQKVLQEENLLEEALKNYNVEEALKDQID